MPHFEELYPSRFLKGVTLARPLTIRIKEFRPEKLEDDKGAMVPKAILAYVDRNGPGEMVCCKTNAALIAAIYGPDYKTWVDKLITVHFDPSVRFGSEKPGGIRVLGSPSLAESLTVTIKRPRRKKVETYILQPTGAQAAAQAVAEKEQAAQAAAAEALGNPAPMTSAAPPVVAMPPAAAPAAAAQPPVPAPEGTVKSDLNQAETIIRELQAKYAHTPPAGQNEHSAQQTLPGAAPIPLDPQQGSYVGQTPIVVGGTGEDHISTICKEIFAIPDTAALLAYREQLQVRRESGELKLTKDQGQRVRQALDSKKLTLEAK